MGNKKFLWAGVTLLLLATLFVAVQSAVASLPTPPGTACGLSPVGGDTVIRVKKNVFCEKDTTWNWDIIKWASASDLTLSLGQEYLVDYLVTVNATPASTYDVSGEILITNLTDNPVLVNDVDDSLGPISACYVMGVPITLPYSLNGHWQIRCFYNGSQATQPSQNVATVNYGAGVDAIATAQISWSGVVPTVTDECANISDTYPGGPQTQVCASGPGQQTFTFPYTRTLGPYDVCGDYTYPNTATFLTTDTGATGSSSWTVNVNVPAKVAAR
jgi:hypothetical protein